MLVAGSTGRVGQLVCKKLLESAVSVRAITRDIKEAKKIFSGQSDLIEIVEANLLDTKLLKELCSDCDAIIWCATGFSSAEKSSPWDKLTGLFRLKFFPDSIIDIAAIKEFGAIFAAKEKDGLPQIIMCSSAGVSRPSWDESKKLKYVGAADIPIVRLNPFNILDRKLEGENILRQSGADYCIVRPCGLNDNWPSGRPLLTQGDLAVGRISRADAASLLVAMSNEANARSKTIEAIALPNFPTPVSYADQLNRLADDGTEISDSALEATYAILQQCTPGTRYHHHNRLIDVKIYLASSPVLIIHTYIHMYIHTIYTYIWITTADHMSTVYLVIVSSILIGTLVYEWLHTILTLSSICTMVSITCCNCSHKL